jgi:hypothetical protein
VHNFLDLSDTPTTYSGSGDYYVRVKSTADGLVFDTVSGTGGASTFLGLTDTPSTYAGSGNYFVRVKSTADGLEFTDFEDDASYDIFVTGVSGVLDGHYAMDDTETSSTSESQVQKLRLTMVPRWTDYYLINFSTNVSHEDTGVFMKLRMQVNDTDTYKESALELYNFKYSDGAYQIWSGSFAHPMVSGTTYNIDMDYASGDSGKAMYIKQASIAAQRLLVEM